ncbi:MAG: DUF421 domain-containing protein [Candidatus Rokubacteria bacterium]|nr:DUF421 domain-containing protein [Candidatus Rokubacteria bacterium]
MDAVLALFRPEIPLWEKVFRTVVVYLFVLIAFRLTGKRQVGQLTPFDLVVLLIISNVVQNAVIGKDDSLGGGIIGAITMLALNYAVVELTFRSRRWRHLLEARPTVLVHDGRVLEDHLRRERLTHEDLLAALRKSGIADLSHVRFAVLEPNGGISVIPFRT